ncbi:MAG: hypothetical protein WA602_19700, partial [Silvibacterium sp.]
MPASIFHAGRFRLLTIAGILCLFGGSYACAAPQRNAAAGPSFKKAQKMREALEGRPERQRTRREYDHVIDAYRAVYRSKPGGS